MTADGFSCPYCGDNFRRVVELEERLHDINDPMPCGHPRKWAVSSDEGTGNCMACLYDARIEELEARLSGSRHHLRMALDVAREYRTWAVKMKAERDEMKDAWIGSEKAYERERKNSDYWGEQWHESCRGNDDLQNVIDSIIAERDNARHLAIRMKAERDALREACTTAETGALEWRNMDKMHVEQRDKLWDERDALKADNEKLLREVIRLTR